MTHKRLVLQLILVLGLSFSSTFGQSLPPKDDGTFSAAQESGSQSEWDAAYAEGVAAGGCRVWCTRLQTLAPVFYCDGGSLFSCSCPEGRGIFIMWREWSHIFTSVACSEFYEGITFNFNTYYNSCYSYPGYSDWNFDACPEDYHWSCSSHGCINNSPIIIDIEGDGFDLTAPESGVLFNFSRDGLDKMAWTAQGSDDAFLVLDRNGNGTIDDGFELFGNLTPQPPSGEPNGFLALAEYDKAQNGGNGDTRIDRHDAIFASLRLWRDDNHNGISEANELNALKSFGIAKIELSYHVSKKTDQYGNKFKYRAKVKDKHGAQVGRWAWDVFFRGGPQVLEDGASARKEQSESGLLSAMLGHQTLAKPCR